MTNKALEALGRKNRALLHWHDFVEAIIEDQSISPRDIVELKANVDEFFKDIMAGEDIQRLITPPEDAA